VAQERMQRRVEAILFADVVGYSRLTGEDEVGTWRRLQNVLRNVVRPQVRQHAGRIVRIKGDGILVEFPSAVEAVSSAVALQQTMAQRNAAHADGKRIDLRIGINLGDILTIDEDIHGDGVNIACRLEPLSDPGGVCMSATVHEHVRAKLAYPFEDRGERTLKNIATPVRIYALGPEIIAKLPRSEPRSDTHEKSWRWYIAAVAVAWLCAAALWALWRYIGPSSEMAAVQTSSLSPRLRPAAEPRVPTGTQPQSIVVLPFTNATGDPEQDYFADGITEDLTTDLSRIPGSFVIAPATAFAYKGCRSTSGKSAATCRYATRCTAACVRAGLPCASMHNWSTPPMRHSCGQNASTERLRYLHECMTTSHNALQEH